MLLKPRMARRRITVKMKLTILSTVVVAVGALFAATEITAQPTPQPTPTSSVSGPYTVNFLGKFPDPDRGELLWQYSVVAAESALRKIKEGVMVVPFPVTPQNILSPTAAFKFCQERDSSTNINRGNCGGFPVPIPPERSSHRVTLEIVTDNRVTEGEVTLNIVSRLSEHESDRQTDVTEGSGTVNTASGSRRSDVCISSETGRGIVGPGALALVPPVTPLVCVKLDDNASLQITRGANFCATGTVRFFTTSTNCTGDATRVEGVPIPGFIYSGDPGGNVRCGELLRQTQRSPARFTYESGGVIYEFCYDNATGVVLDCRSF
jgi:hypothetical protein